MENHSFFYRVISELIGEPILWGPFDTEAEALLDINSTNEFGDGEEVQILKLVASGVVSKEITWRH